MTSSELNCLRRARDIGKFTCFELAAQCGVNASAVQRSIRIWLDQEFIECIGRNEEGRRQYKFIADHPALPKAPPLANTSRIGNMWIAMRGLVEFTPVDIAAHANTEELPLSQQDAQEYCQKLNRAGYLKTIRKARPGRHPALYRLTKNTGPKPPRERRIRTIYDDNLAEYTYVPVGAS